MLPIVLWQIRLILPSVMYYALLCVVVNKLTLCIYILVVFRHADIIQCCNNTIFPLQSLTTNQTNQVFVEHIILNLIIFLGIITEKYALWERQTVYRITLHRTFILTLSEGSTKSKSYQIKWKNCQERKNFTIKHKSTSCTSHNLYTCCLLYSHWRH